MADLALLKYPRTPHLEGSRLQPGDEDLAAVRLAELRERHLVIEEKLDGANCAVSFDPAGRLLLQSRGHYLVGGERECHFARLKGWASVHADALRTHLGSRYVMYGEWLHVKHTVFYDCLPHWFLEFDVRDRSDDTFLSTPARQALLAGLPIARVPVLHSGPIHSRAQLESLLGRSRYQSPNWRQTLRDSVAAQGLNVERAIGETDPSDQMEGLYIKAESEGRVIGRYKYVRASFLTNVTDSGSHWLQRPIITNRLADGVDVYAP